MRQNAPVVGRKLYLCSMTIDELIERIAGQVGHVPTADQAHALQVFARFMFDRADASAMILRGSAGTGKTTVASAMVRTLRQLGVKTVLLAPTGRAAKVFSLNSGQEASTIHRKIYRQKSLESGFGLGFNAHRDTLFLVDEASMIANDGRAESVFGTGRLLDDLVSFVYGGQGCRLMLIGDRAQLPPVGEEASPALEGSVMRGYGLHVYEADLDEVVRQSQESGILWNATRIRNLTLNIRFTGFADVRRVTGDELIEQLASSYSRVGVDETMVVTRSNKRAVVYNMGIRNTILGREEELTSGDRLMVVKNKYLSARSSQSSRSAQSSPDSQEQGLTFIANGDMAVVQRVRNIHEMHGFRFADVWVQFPDYDGEEMQLRMLLDTLQTEAPALTREQSAQLYNKVLEDYADVRPKTERLKRIKEDPYYTAMQVKYGYAVTCHKAQGGQWAHVYIDQGYITEDMLDRDYAHWLYTAFTRATEQVFLVNWKTLPPASPL